MPRSTSTIPKAPLGRILLNAGAKRVSKDGMEALSDVLQERAEAIAHQAAKVARHAKRKTIVAGDIKLAAE